MNLILQLKELKENFPDQILLDENLSKYSWFNLGGPAKVLYKPSNLIELSTFLKNINGYDKIKVLGAGSNTLIRDGGYDGIVIKFGKAFSHMSLFNENTLIAGTSALDKKVSDFACQNSLTGLEFLSCIPGTIGGGIRMNSGCYGEDISKNIISVQAMDLNGKMRIINSSEIEFSYRKCSLKNDLIFVSATLKGENGKKSEIENKMKNLIERKKKEQPSKIKTCGSTFKNPENNKAWKLIKDSGCSGMKVGDACISEKHCNFFMNLGKAKSEDLENLINKVKKRVLEKTGVNLELEIQIIGEKL